jgi:hypothetical protein
MKLKNILSFFKKQFFGISYHIFNHKINKGGMNKLYMSWFEIYMFIKVVGILLGVGLIAYFLFQ